MEAGRGEREGMVNYEKTNLVTIYPFFSKKKGYSTQRKGYTNMTKQIWSPKILKNEIENLAMEMWLGNKLARAVGVLSIHSFDEDERPIDLATAAVTLKFIKYKIKEESTTDTAHLQNQ